MKKGQILMGPAGSGKSTYCLEIFKNLVESKESVQIINLDPSIENMEYPDSIDIRDLIKIEDVMEEFNLGPNGGLIFCMEYFMENLDWFHREIENSMKKNLIFDLPGQIELYTHSNLIRDFCFHVKKLFEIDLFGIFLLDCTFIGDIGKFFGGALTALCSMFSLEISHYNIISKIDLISHTPYGILENFLFPSYDFFNKELNQIINKKYRFLTKTLVRILADFSMVQFIPLDLTRSDQVTNFISLLNIARE
jgi:GTPase SAR1 family protein